jgi:putative transposase
MASTPPAHGLVHHSGCRYTLLAFGRRCRGAGIVPSTGHHGYDNALAESYQCHMPLR